MVRSPHLGLLTGGALLLAAAATLWFVADRGAGMDQSGRQSAPDDPMEAPGVEAAAGRDRVRESPARVESAPAPAPEPAKLAILRGRCVDAERRTPLAGCIATLDAQEWRSGEDGTFRIELSQVSGPRKSIAVRHEDRPTVACEILDLAIGQERDLGDIPLTTGSVVHGYVTDVDGRPLGSADIRLHNLDLDRSDDSPGRWRAVSSSHATSAADGSFRMPFVLGAGLWGVRADKDGYHLVEPAQVRVPSGSAPQPLRITMQTSRSIRGRVVDEAGKAFTAAIVEASTRSGSMAHARVAPDGTFCIHAPNGTDTHADLRLMLAPGVQVVRRPETVRWGATGVEFVVHVRELQHVLVRAFRASDRTAVQAFDARLRPIDRPLRSVPFPSRTTNGLIDYWNMEPGPYDLVVAAADPDLRPRLVPRFDVLPDRPTEIEALLESMAPWSVRVVDAERRPIAAATVELVEFGDGPNKNVSNTLPLHWQRGEYSQVWGPVWRPYHCISHGTTGSDGMAAMHRPASDEGLILLVHADGWLPIRLDPPAFRGDPHEIMLHRAATLEGRVLGLDPAWHGLVILRPIPPSERSRAELRLPVAADGTFSAASVIPGQWQPSLHGFHRPEPRSRGELPQALLPNLAAVEIRAPGVNRFEIDARELRPARVRGIALWNGAPLANARIAAVVALPATGSQPNVHAVDARTSDPDGSFELPPVPPGRARLSLTVQQGPAERISISLDDELTLAPGQLLDRRFEFPQRRIRVRLIDAAGKPLPDAEFQLSGRDCHTDANGECRFDWMPDRTFTVRWRGKTLLKDEFPAGGGELVREVVVRE